MNLDKKTTRTLYLLILFAVVVNVTAQNLNAIRHAVDVLIGILSPLLLGLMLAFLLSVPVNLLEKRLIKPHGKRALGFQEKIRRPLSVLLSVLIIMVVFAAIIIILIPRLFDALSILFTRLPFWVESVKAELLRFRDTSPEVVEWVEAMTVDWSSAQESISNFLKNGLGNAVDGIVNTATSVFGQATSMVLTIIIALSVVAQKERLAGQTRRVVRAFFKKPVADRIIEITRQTGRAFSGFISAQVLEAFILGTLVLLGMSIFRFPHALLISAIVTVAAVVPIFGALFSGFVGTLLILVTNGLGQALWFLVFILVLQQIEGNLIYPRVMGSNVGLPALWVLVAITLGGGAMGVLGMLISVPICAVCYSLLRDALRARDKKEQIDG